MDFLLIIFCTFCKIQSYLTTTWIADTMEEKLQSVKKTIDNFFRNGYTIFELNTETFEIEQEFMKGCTTAGVFLCELFFRFLKGGFS